MLFSTQRLLNFQSGARANAVSAALFLASLGMNFRLQLGHLSGYGAFGCQCSGGGVGLFSHQEESGVSDSGREGFQEYHHFKLKIGTPIDVRQGRKTTTANVPFAQLLGGVLRPDSRMPWNAVSSRGFGLLHRRSGLGGVSVGHTLSCLASCTSPPPRTAPPLSVDLTSELSGGNVLSFLFFSFFFLSKKNKKKRHESQR